MSLSSQAPEKSLGFSEKLSEKPSAPGSSKAAPLAASSKAATAGPSKAGHGSRTLAEAIPDLAPRFAHLGNLEEYEGRQKMQRVMLALQVRGGRYTYAWTAVTIDMQRHRLIHSQCN